MLQALMDFLDSDNWNYEETDYEGVLKMGLNGENGQYTLFAIVDEEEEKFEFLSKIPITVPENKRSSVAEFLTRANYGLKYGHFEMDLDDGEVNFKTNTPFEQGTVLEDSVIEKLLYSNVLIVDRYFPAMMKVIYGGTTAEEAIREIEGR